MFIATSHDVLLATQSPDVAGQTAIEQLDPPKRAAVLMVLLGLLLLALGLIAITMIGARWVRRISPPPRAPLRRQGRQGEPKELDKTLLEIEANPGETFLAPPASNDTIVDD